MEGNGGVDTYLELVGGAGGFFVGKLRRRVSGRMAAGVGVETSWSYSLRGDYFCSRKTCLGVHPIGAETESGEDGGACSFVAFLNHLIIDHASFSRRSTVPTPNRATFNVWALITLVPYITYELFAYPIPVLFRRLWPPSIS